FTERRPDQRVLEGRQMQVRDYYNFAVQQAVTHLFESHDQRPPVEQEGKGSGSVRVQVGAWTMRASSELTFGADDDLPQDLIPASSLNFQGLRNQYRRDGAGAMLVAVTADRVVTQRSVSQPFSESPFPAMTAVMSFPGNSLEEVLRTDQVMLNVYDPYRHATINRAGTTFPRSAEL